MTAARKGMRRIGQAVRTYHNNRRPPWVWPRPQYPLYVVLSEEEAEAWERGLLHEREALRRQAEEVLYRRGSFPEVAVYNAGGELLLVISREA